MTDNPIALVDNRCKAWIGRVPHGVVIELGFGPGPKRGAIQGLPFGRAERPKVNMKNIGN